MNQTQIDEDDALDVLLEKHIAEEGALTPWSPNIYRVSFLGRKQQRGRFWS